MVEGGRPGIPLVQEEPKRTHGKLRSKLANLINNQHDPRSYLLPMMILAKFKK
jgi:hypothetical protein